MEQLRHVGYTNTKEENDYFSIENIKHIGDEVAAAFKNTHVVLLPEIIKGLLEKNYYDYRPPQSDIFSAFQIEPFTEKDKFMRAREITINMLINEVQARIFDSQVATTLDIDIINYTKDLAQVPSIKLKNKRAATMQFHMRY